MAWKDFKEWLLPSLPPATSPSKTKRPFQAKKVKPQVVKRLRPAPIEIVHYGRGSFRIGRDKQGIFIYNHHTRSASYTSYENIPATEKRRISLAGWIENLKFHITSKHTSTMNKVFAGLFLCISLLCFAIKQSEAGVGLIFISAFALFSKPNAPN